MLDEEVIACQNCFNYNLEINDNSRSDMGYGKLLSWLLDELTTTDIMVVGLNPSHRRFPGLKHHFSISDFCKHNEGKVFAEMLIALDVYPRCFITNLVKCSTQFNKVSNADMRSCFFHLQKEIEYARPKLILACGKQVFNFLNIRPNINVPIEYIFHPSYCFSYKRCTPEEYFEQVKGVLIKHGLYKEEDLFNR